MYGLFAIIGLIYRRIWGGFYAPPHIIKVLFAYPLAFSACFLQTGDLYASVTFGIIIGTSFNNPCHAWGQGMGSDPTKPAWKCIAVMGGSYGLFTTMAAAGLVYFTHNILYSFYGLSGFLSPIAYSLCIEDIDMFFFLLICN